jgi:hypothetical protein
MPHRCRIAAHNGFWSYLTLAYGSCPSATPPSNSSATQHDSLSDDNIKLGGRRRLSRLGGGG